MNENTLFIVFCTSSLPPFNSPEKLYLCYEVKKMCYHRIVINYDTITIYKSLNYHKHNNDDV